MSVSLTISSSLVSVLIAVFAFLPFIFDASHATINQTENNNATTTASLPDSNPSIELPNAINFTGNASDLLNLDNLLNGTLVNNTVANQDLASIAQLSGNEDIVILANFSSKPGSFTTDYIITGKPLILIDGEPLNFEYPVDTNDEIVLSDILMSMRASIKINGDVSSGNFENNVYQIRVFSNPDNITEHPNGTKTYVNSPNNIEHIDLDGSFYYEMTSFASLYPNGTGVLKANN